MEGETAWGRLAGDKRGSVETVGRCRQQSGPGGRRSTAPVRSTSGDCTGRPGRRSDGGPHIKKPLNAFMVFMKEMRQTVIDECTLKSPQRLTRFLVVG